MTSVVFADDALLPEGMVAPRLRRWLVGHEDSERTFAEAYADAGASSARSWLIVGPQGVGKATFAHRMARGLLRGRFTPPGEEEAQDSVFAQASAGARPDFLLLTRAWDAQAKRAATRIGVDQARKLRSFFAHGGGRRACVIDAADEMNAQAQNALLKTLEEPPRQAALILVASRPGLLAATVRSRCLTLRLAPLPDALARETARRLVEETTAAVGDEALAMASRLAAGAAGRMARLMVGGAVGLMRGLDAAVAGGRGAGAARVRLARSVAGSDSSAFETLLECMQFLCSQAARRAMAQAEDANSEANSEANAKARLERLVGVWDNLARVRDETLRYGLDKERAARVALDALGEALE